jgi:hypothetical protein
MTTDIVTNSDLIHYTFLSPLSDCLCFLSVCPTNRIPLGAIARQLLALCPFNSLGLVLRDNRSDEEEKPRLEISLWRILKISVNISVIKRCCWCFLKVGCSDELTFYLKRIIRRKIVRASGLANAFFRCIFANNREVALELALEMLDDLTGLEGYKFAVKLWDQESLIQDDRFFGELRIRYPFLYLEDDMEKTTNFFRATPVNLWPLNPPTFFLRVLRILHSVSPKISVNLDSLPLVLFPLVMKNGNLNIESFELNRQYQIKDRYKQVYNFSRRMQPFRFEFDLSNISGRFSSNFRVLKLWTNFWLLNPKV